MQIITESLVSAILMLGWIFLLVGLGWLAVDAWNKARRIPMTVRQVVTRARKREVWTRIRP